MYQKTGATTASAKFSAQRFDGGAGDPGPIEAGNVAADDVRDRRPSGREAVGQRDGHGVDVLIKTALSQERNDQQEFDDPAERQHPGNRRDRPSGSGGG